MAQIRRFALVLAVGVLLGILPVPSSGTHPKPSSATVKGYDLRGISLPNFAYLYPYLYNYRLQYPVLDFAAPCLNGLLYIDNSSYLDCFNTTNGTVSRVAGPVTLLYQRTSGIQAQIDNEFQLDTPYPVALIYGNRTTSPGNVTVEAINLTTGTIQIANTPVPMANSVQCDYVGRDLVVTLNGTGSHGAPEITNLSNGTSWRSGLSVGVATNNAYWVAQLNAFIDVAGPHVAELQLVNGDTSMKNVGNSWLNRSGLSSVTAVNGVQYRASSGQFVVDLATNLGNELGVVQLTGGVLTPAGAYSWISTYSIYVERYTYTSPYLWAENLTTDATLLADPLDAQFSPAPNVVTRANGSGANQNYEFSNPYTTNYYLSLNSSLIGNATRAPNQFVWASLHPNSGGGGGGGSGSTVTPPTTTAPQPLPRVTLTIPPGYFVAGLGVGVAVAGILVRGRFLILVPIGALLILVGVAL